jgi:DNA-directed RNA polymerase subunit RPC12/RpoP
MSIKSKQHNTSLLHAYNTMTNRIRYSLENAEAYAIPSLQKALEQAKNQAIHLGEVTLEEADEIADYIKHDINDSAEYLMESSHEFSEWLLLDIDIIEKKVVELFLSVADKTQLELAQFSRPAVDLIINFKSGEKTNSATVICAQCKHAAETDAANSLLDCRYCGSQNFKQMPR